MSVAYRRRLHNFAYFNDILCFRCTIAFVAVISIQKSNNCDSCFDSALHSIQNFYATSNLMSNLSKKKARIDFGTIFV